MIDGVSEHDVLGETPRPARKLAVSTRLRALCARLGTILTLTWEVYAIVLIAAFLRLLHIEVTDFDYDQSNIFRMAYAALHHGWLVATANGASIPILNPPAIIYLLMLPAALSANPLGAAVMVALSAVAAVLLTYIFVRRYFGRLAGTFAALLFATAGRAVFYSRFSWNQNFIPFFLLLFLFALFAGVVERRKGWLFPAILLLGLLYQLHATTSLLVAPLLVALCLSPGTVRWRDLVYGLLSLLVLYSPYLLWEFAVHFADIKVLLAQSKLPSHIDNSALNYYLFYFSPYATPFTNGEPFTNTRSVLYAFYPLLSWLRPLLTMLIIVAALVAAVQVIWVPRSKQNEQTLQAASTAPWTRLYAWWQQLRATPYRCALLVLLTWQVITLLALSRHSVPIYPHYLIVLMPGQYILIGIFLALVIHWLRGAFPWPAVAHWRSEQEQEAPAQEGMTQYSRLRGALSIGVCVLLGCIILAQFIGSTGNVLDYARGNYSDTGLSRPYYNDLHSLQNALQSADQLAVQRHIQRVYVVTDNSNQTALTYLAEQMQTPTTLFDGARCLVLPAPGPAVMLLGPRSTLAGALLTHFARADLIGQPHRLGGPPFQLYIVNSNAQQPTTQQFQNHLSLLDAHAQHLTLLSSSWLVTRWTMRQTAQKDFRVTYGYKMTIGGSGGINENSQCVFSAIHAGDQLLVAFPGIHIAGNGGITVQAQYYTIKPRYLVVGGLTFESDAFPPPAWTSLKTTTGKQSILLAS